MTSAELVHEKQNTGFVDPNCCGPPESLCHWIDENSEIVIAWGCRPRGGECTKDTNDHGQAIWLKPGRDAQTALEMLELMFGEVTYKWD